MAGSSWQLFARPGLIVGRVVDQTEIKSVGGIVIPNVKLPIIKVIHDGGLLNEDTSSMSPSDLERVSISEGKMYVVRSAEVMIHFGYDRIVIVSYDDVIAQAEVM